MAQRISRDTMSIVLSFLRQCVMHLYLNMALSVLNVRTMQQARPRGSERGRTMSGFGLGLQASQEGGPSNSFFSLAENKQGHSGRKARERRASPLLTLCTYYKHRSTRIYV